MPRLLSLGTALVLLVGFASAPARAAEMQVDATLSVVLSELGGPSLTGSGTGTSDGQFLGASIPAGLLSLPETAEVVIAPPVINLDLITVAPPVENAAGTFSVGGGGEGGLGGAMGNDGIANLFFTNDALAGSLPLGPVGGGGTLTATVAGIAMTVVGAVWTDLGVTAMEQTKTIQIVEAPFSIPVTVTATAFDNRTAGGAGTLQLVAPAVVQLLGGTLGNLPVVGVLRLQFAPEPGTTLLFGSAVVALLAMARVRARS